MFAATYRSRSVSRAKSGIIFQRVCVAQQAKPDATPGEAGPAMTRNTWQFLIPLSMPTERHEVKPSAAPSTGCPRWPVAGVEARLHDGRRYARFRGKVSVSDTDLLTVELLDAAGTTGMTLSFNPRSNQSVQIEGGGKTLQDIGLGEILTLWVCQGYDMQAMPSPDSSGISEGIGSSR